MRFTNPALSKTNIKMFAVLFTLISTNFLACKSSIDEDIIQTEPSEQTTAAKSDLIDYISGSISYVRNASLKDHFNFPIGTAVVKERLDDPVYTRVLNRDFNSVTVESSLNFGATHPKANTYDFVKPDAIVNYALSNGMRVHGSTLLYPGDSMMPPWIKNFQGDKKAWKQILHKHILKVVGHFKGRIKAWDVCNEAIKDNGELKDNIWLRNIGSDYIGLAFKYAHEADPSALLFYNDYGQEYGGAKWKKILSMVADAKDNGVHIDGLAFQLHTVLRMEPEKIKQYFVEAANTGLLVYISEFDVSVRYQKPNIFDLDLLLAQRQGEEIKQIVNAYIDAVPEKQQYGITMWGIADTDSFWNKQAKSNNHDYPLLFDGLYNPKPAYTGFLAAGR
jgi:endo-1,4-beta-xylanase